MNQDRIRLLAPVFLACVLTIGLGGCDRAAKVRKIADETRPLLNSELITVRGEHYAPDSNQLVLLVGENHASVKAQKQLATVASSLAESNVIDTVLLEGVNGTVDVGALKTRLSGEAGADANFIGTFWQQQLDSGMLAGYEFVALTRPTLEMFGVEDMAAKARNGSALEEEGLIESKGLFVRGADLLDKAAAALRAGGVAIDGQPVHTELTAARQAALAYGAVVDRTTPLLAPVWRAREAMQLQQPAMEAVARRLQAAQPLMDQRDEWAKRANVLVSEGRALSARLPDGQLSVPSSTEPDPGVAETEAKLTRLTSELQELRTKIETFDAEHASDFAALTAWQDAGKAMNEAATGAEPVMRERNDADDAAANAYFIAANSLRGLSSQRGIVIPALHAFFRDEGDQARSNSSAHSTLLAERDMAMATNTADYLLQHQNKRVVLLVIGSAHLPGLERELAARHVSYLSGELTASKLAIEAWEQEAWSQRHRAGRAVFSGRPSLKELPQLLNEGWRTEQVEKFKLFRQFQAPGTLPQPSIDGLAWNSRIFEGIGGEDRALRVGRFPFDRSAQVGTHVLDRGPVPGRSGEFYELVDRRLAASQAKMLSDADDQFIYYYKSATGREAGSEPGYRFRSGDDEWSFEQFTDKMRGESGTARAPKRVVIFGESDEIMDGDVAMSPLWRKLQAGSGNAGGPPPTPPRRLGFSEPEPPRRGGGAGGDGTGTPPPEPPQGGIPGGGAGLRRWAHLLLPMVDARPRPKTLRTINAERARSNLRALDKQRVEYIGDVHFATEADMANLSSQLMFTPERGDHSQMVVLMGHNVPELRAAIRSAGEARLLKGKQVALVMCGDSFGETAALRESLLRDGALMVWTNDRQITEQAGKRLVEYVKVAAGELPAADRKTVDDLMARAIAKWREQAPNDADIASFSQAATYVLLAPDAGWDDPSPGILDKPVFRLAV